MADFSNGTCLNRGGGGRLRCPIGKSRPFKIRCFPSSRTDSSISYRVPVRSRSLSRDLRISATVVDEFKVSEVKSMTDLGKHFSAGGEPMSIIPLHRNSLGLWGNGGEDGAGPKQLLDLLELESC